MTKILHVHGDDYAALQFERCANAGKVDPKVLWADAVALDDSLEYEEEDAFFVCDALLFEDVDPDFIEFVKSELVDYDTGKHANIYVVDD